MNSLAVQAVEVLNRKLVNSMSTRDRLSKDPALVCQILDHLLGDYETGSISAVLNATTVRVELIRLEINEK